MPTLNQADFIAAAVASVISQRIDSLELVVVDGGSTDGTQKRLRALTEAHPGRIRWVSAPDAGPAAAVNHAAGLARGELLGWLNSDDLYAAGAVQRVLDHFDAHPRQQMVYGHGEHIDLFGAHLERYPTRGPDTPVEAFATGCFICQPTVFLRRASWQAAGGLDETLRASFDFDLWLRLFKALPGQIGFIDAVLAQSRLHQGGITLRQRERVALEGMAVLKRHLGHAPLDWLLTHVLERCAQHPFEAEPTDLLADMQALALRAGPLLTAEAQATLAQRLQAHRGLQLASPWLFVDVHEDGWAPPSLQLRWRQPAQPARALRLHGRHARPDGGALRLTAHDGSGAACAEAVVAENGAFHIDLPLGDARAGARLLLRLDTPDSFVPAEVEAGSADRRALAYLVEACEALA